MEVKGRIARRGATLEILLRNARPDEFAWKFAAEARRTPRERINSVTSNERRRWREELGRRRRRKGRPPAIDPPKFAVHIGYDRVQREYIKAEC